MSDDKQLRPGTGPVWRRLFVSDHPDPDHIIRALTNAPAGTRDRVRAARVPTPEPLCRS